MSLEETKKDLEKQLEEALKAEQEKAEEPIEAAEEPKEEPVEEPKEEPKVEEDKGPARLRREAAAAAKRAEAAEERAREMEERLKAKEVEQPVERPQLAPEVQEIIEDRTRTKAWEELQSFEAQTRARNPDFDGVAGAYVSALAQSIRTLEPDLTPHQIVEKTKSRILNEAASLLNQGFGNPTEEMYHRLKERGYKAAEPAEDKEVKPDMAKVAANRAKSAGMAGAAGESKAQITPEAVGQMTSAQYMKLSKAEKDAVMEQLKRRA